MSSSLDCLDLCRLCLIKDRVSVPIFEDEGDVRQIFLKITACLPVKVSRDDKLPKKICDDCVYKVELFYQFWNTTANAEKQLLQWLGEVDLEDKQTYVTEVLDTNVMKQEQNSDNRLEGNVIQVSGHQNNMDIGMIEDMTIMTIPAGSEQQFTTVPMDTSGTVQTVQAVPGPSTHDQMGQSQTHLVTEEVEESEEEENSDDGCDNEEGLPVKEETEEVQTETFVNVPISCDEAGPSGLQQQKVTEMSEMSMTQTATDGDPKTGTNNPHWCRKKSIMSRIRVRGPSELGETNFFKVEDNFNKTKPKKSTLKRKLSNTLENNEIIESPRKKYNSKKEAAKSRKTTPKKSASKQKLSDPLDIFEVSKPLKIEADGKDSSKIAEESAELRMYKKLKSGEYGCKICMEKYPDRHKIRQHMESKHVPPKTYKCADCDKVYKSKSQLYLHTIRHRDNSDYMLCCDKCDFRAKSKYYLKTHQIRKHTDDYNFECDHCKKRFKMKMDLKMHISIHADFQHMCDICGRMYTSQDAVYRHRRVVHINEYKFQCEICNQKLLTEENLKNHMKSHDSLHCCDECDVKFTKKRYLTRHKKRVHKVEKNNLCTVCGKSFACAATLRVHYLTHAKVKPYICNVCGFCFTQRSSMMLHWKKKHPDAENPPPPVILTNFFDAMQSEVHRLVETTSEPPSQ